MKRGSILLAATLAVAAWLALFGDKAPAEPQVVEPVARTSPPPTDPVPMRKSTVIKPQIPIVALVERRSLFDDVSEPAAQAPRLFSPRSWTPPPPPPPPPPAPPPPVPPPLPFTFTGKKLENAKWEVYLISGDQVAIARAGETLNTTYRIKSIEPPNMTIIYLPLDAEQSMNIGAAQ